MEQQVFSATEVGKILGTNSQRIILSIRRREILSLPMGPETKTRYRIPRSEVERLLKPEIPQVNESPEARRLKQEIKILRLEIARLNYRGQGETPKCISDIGPGLSEYCGFSMFPPCVYFLLSGSDVVYVGQSVSLAARISTHRSEGYKAFDRVYYLPVDRSQLNHTERAHISKFRPKYNGDSLFKKKGDLNG